MFLNAVAGLILFFASIIIGGWCYLILTWFMANRLWRRPFGWYFDWINQKANEIKAKAEAKRLSEEWKEMNRVNDE